MQAIILAGGYGTRLRSVVSDVPKPMAPIQSKPFLAYLLDKLASEGFSKVVLAVGYQYQVIIDYFGSHYKTMQLDYVIETDLLGTGGAINNALSYLSSDTVFVLNGDTYFDIDYRAMFKKREMDAVAIMLALKMTPDISRYGSVLIEGSSVVSFQEKGATGAGIINAGVYLIKNDLLSCFDLPKAFSFEQQFLYPCVKQVKPGIFLGNGYFIDIGVPEDYQRAQTELPLQFERLVAMSD